MVCGWHCVSQAIDTTVCVKGVRPESPALLTPSLESFFTSLPSVCLPIHSSFISPGLFFPGRKVMRISLRNRWQQDKMPPSYFTAFPPLLSSKLLATGAESSPLPRRFLLYLQKQADRTPPWQHPDCCAFCLCYLSSCG